MSSPTPIYTSTNCRPAYQLNWTLSVFWNHATDTAEWLDGLKKATEPDGVRVLQHRFIRPGVSQFLLSTKPEVAPSQFVRSVKGRLQHLVRDDFPKAFRRNYGFRSIGSVKRNVIENYVRSQTEHHAMADPGVQWRLERFQIRCDNVDLSHPQRSAHAVSWYNLHVAFVHESRYMEIREEQLQAVREMILKISENRAYRLSSAGILPDHYPPRAWLRRRPGTGRRGSLLHEQPGVCLRDEAGFRVRILPGNLRRIRSGCNVVA